MQNKRRFFVIVLMLLCLLHSGFAQNGQPPAEMADGMRSSGKIYVVIAVILTILAGLILYVVRLDRKITRLEKES